MVCNRTGIGRALCILRIRVVVAPQRPTNHCVGRLWDEEVEAKFSAACSAVRKWGNRPLEYGSRDKEEVGSIMAGWMGGCRGKKWIGDPESRSAVRMCAVAKQARAVGCVAVGSNGTGWLLFVAVVSSRSASG